MDCCVCWALGKHASQHSQDRNVDVMNGHTRKYKMSNGFIHKQLSIALIEDKMGENRWRLQETKGDLLNS